MNCLPNISVALSLLALTAGVFLMYKVQKENLSILYKIAAWFIIILAIGNMACCGMRCNSGGCGEDRECRKNKMHDDERESRGLRVKEMNNCNIWMSGSCEENEECDENATCDKEKEDNCCDKEKEGECKMMKKDSVCIMKKK